MGDITTHAIFYQAYWALAYQDAAGNWLSSETMDPICGPDDPDKIVELPK